MSFDRSDPLTEEEKFKAEEQKEHELASLQRQHNILEKDHRLHVGGHQFGHLGNVLNIFEQEHRNIVTDLNVATGSANKLQDAKDAVRLIELLDDYDTYKGGVEKERKEIREIEGEIKKVNKEVARLRFLQTADRQEEERVWTTATTTLQQLMEKLDVQNKKFGVICAKNRQLRQEIERMLYERSVFLKTWNTMIHKLDLGKRYMMDLIQQATIAYDQREHWMSKLQTMRIRAHREYLQHLDQMRELKTKQEQNKKLTEFLETKSKKRIIRDLIEKEKIKKHKKKIEIEKQVTQYRQYMADILEFTKEERTDQIARKYCNQERDNFSRFQQINNLMEEIEELGYRLQELYKEIDERRELGNSIEFQEKSMLQALEMELTAATKKEEEAQEDLKKIEVYIQTMLSGIDKLFKLCRCNDDSILQLLADKGEVSIHNVFLYLQMIESVVHKAFVEVHLIEKHSLRRLSGESAKLAAVDHTDQFRPVEAILETKSLCPLCVEKEFVSDVVVKAQHVMTREEAKKAIQSRVQLPNYMDKLHTVAKCLLPQARDIIHKAFRQ